jgi:chromatin remodeling complex protein RSC6
MAKMTKATKTDAPAPAPTPAPTPVVDDKTTKVKKVKATKVETAAPIETAASVTPARVEGADPVIDGVDASIAQDARDFSAKLQQLSIIISTMKSDFRSLEKKMQREVKTAQKQSSKRKKKSGNRAPSGFVKPTRISDELASFLGKDKGAEMARTAVTKEINAYIRTHDLQDKTNGRKIIPDNKLASLLKLKKDDELTYFNLQKYMSCHFEKSAKAIAAAAAATAAARAVF